MSFHKNMVGLDNHVPHTFEYADVVARLAATGFVASDVGKWAFQIDTKEYYRLDAVTPTWTLVGGGGGGIPGGADTNVQFNNAGVFAGSANFLWNQTLKLQTTLGNIDQAIGTAATPGVPVLLSTTGVGSNPRLMTVAANYAYIVESTADELRIYDVTDPTVPALIGTLVIAGTNFRGVEVSGRYVYVTDATGGTVKVIDAIDKSNPVEVGSVTVGGTPRGLRASGNTVFMTGNDGTAGIVSIDVSDPANPVVLQTLNTGDGIRIEFDIVGNILYVCSIGASNNVRTYDVTDPSNMLLLDQWDSGSDAWGIKVQGRYAYVLAAQDGEFQIYDITDPDNVDPVPDGQVTGLAFEMRAFAVSGNFAYLTNQGDDSLKVVDVSDPTTPVVVATATITPNPVSAFLVGKIMYVLDNSADNMTIYDVGGMQVQNMNVGSIDAGNLNVRRDGFFGNNVIANAASLGQGGLLSDGDVVSSGDLRAIGDALATNADLSGFLNLEEIVTPANPATGDARLYAKPVSGTSALFLLDDAGVEATVLTSIWAVAVDASAFDLSNMGVLSFDDLNTSIVQNNFDMQMDVAAGGAFDLRVDNMSEYDFDAIRADFKGNDLINAGEIHSATGNIPVLGFLKMDDGDFLAWRNAANTDDNAVGFFSDELQLVFDSVIRYAFTDVHLNLTGRDLFDTGVALFGTSIAPAATVQAVWADAGGMNFNVPTGDEFDFFINGISTFAFSASQADFKGNDLINVGNTAGKGVATKPDNVVQVFTESDFPDVGGFIVPTAGMTYEVMNPITLTKRMKHPTTVSGFDPATIRTSAKQVNIVTVNVGLAVFLDSPSIDGQIVFQNIILQSDGLGPFAHVVGNTQTGTLTELDDANVLDFADGTFFNTCIFNVNNESFWSNSGTFDLIDAECNVDNAFNANFVGINNPVFRVRSSGPSAPFASFLSVRNSKLSSQTGESFFYVHNNLVAGSTIRLNGVDKSPFTSGNGTFFGVETGSITALADSGGAPGVRTLVFASGHDVADGDTVVQSGFVTETQMNGTFVASNIVSQDSYEIVAVFSATDTGSYVASGLDQKDPKITAFDNPGQQDSAAIGSLYVVGNTDVTVIATQDTFTDLDLGTALEAGSISRWSLTDAVNGELTYDGMEPFSGTLFAQLSATGASGSPEYRFRAVKNGAVLPDAIETVLEAPASNISSVGLVAPVSVVNGDTIRLQVENVDNTTNITVSNISISIQ